MPTLSRADASSPAVRASACGAVQALSRSAKDLRGELCRPAVAAALCRLLRDPAPPVQSAAVAALCNAVLEFSLLKVRCARLPLRGHDCRLRACRRHCVSEVSPCIAHVW